jgi:endoglucanase
VIGYAVQGRNLSSVLCVPSGRASLGTGETVWFDKGDNRRGPGGDFATGNYKGQCADTEAVTGIAYRSWIWSRDKEPDALLCRRL